MLQYFCGFSTFCLGTTPEFMKYKVQLELMTSKEKIILKKSNQKIERYNGNIFHDLNKYSPATRFKNFRDTEEMTLKYTIEVYDNSKEPEQIQINNANEDLEKSLKCNICQVYMTGPIYICIMGHSMCGSCRQVITRCPYCKVNMSASRNYTLEEIAAKIRIPCQNASDGCTFIGDLVSLKTHEETCYF